MDWMSEGGRPTAASDFGARASSSPERAPSPGQTPNINARIRTDTPRWRRDERPIEQKQIFLHVNYIFAVVGSNVTADLFVKKIYTQFNHAIVNFVVLKARLADFGI
jgi:hypothetical protein